MRYIIAIQLYIYHKYHISCINDILSKYLYNFQIYTQFVSFV